MTDKQTINYLLRLINIKKSRDTKLFRIERMEKDEDVKKGLQRIKRRLRLSNILEKHPQCSLIDLESMIIENKKGVLITNKINITEDEINFLEEYFNSKEWNNNGN